MQLQIALMDMQRGTGVALAITGGKKMFGAEKFDKVVFDRLRARGIAFFIFYLQFVFSETYFDASDIEVRNTNELTEIATEV